METLPGLGGRVETEWDILTQYVQPELPVESSLQDELPVEEV